VRGQGTVAGDEQARRCACREDQTLLGASPIGLGAPISDEADLLRTGRYPCAQGAEVKPKMALLPNGVGGVWQGDGFGSGLPVARDWKVSTAGQLAASPVRSRSPVAGSRPGRPDGGRGAGRPAHQRSGSAHRQRDGHRHPRHAGRHHRGRNLSDPGDDQDRVTGRYAVALCQLGPGLGYHITVRSGSRTAATDLYIAAGQVTTFLVVLDVTTRSG